MYSNSCNIDKMGFQRVGRFMSNAIDLCRVWRDRILLSEIQSEISRQYKEGWRAWEILLPPDLLYPMISEISECMMTTWSPVVNGVGVQVGQQNEIAIRFVLPDVNPSPVKIKAMKYIPKRADDIIPVGVNGH